MIKLLGSIALLLQVLLGSIEASEMTKVEKRSHHLIGFKFKTKKSLFYFKKLPSKECANRMCARVAPLVLGTIENTCSGCLDDKRLTTKIRLEIVPAGTQLQVIEAYDIIPVGLAKVFNSTTSILILQDERGQKSEIQDFYVSKKGIEGFNPRTISKLEKKILESTKTINKKGELAEWRCLSLQGLAGDRSYERRDWKRVKKLSEERRGGHILKFGPYIELKIAHFISSFQLSKEMDVPEIAILLGRQKSAFSCAKVIFKSIDSYLLSNYYFEEWGLYTRSYREDKKARELCSTQTSDRKKCYDYIRRQSFKLKPFIGMALSNISRFHIDQKEKISGLERELLARAKKKKEERQKKARVEEEKWREKIRIENATRAGLKGRLKDRIDKIRHGQKVSDVKVNLKACSIRETSQLGDPKRNVYPNFQEILSTGCKGIIESRVKTFGGNLGANNVRESSFSKSFVSKVSPRSKRLVLEEVQNTDAKKVYNKEIYLSEVDRILRDNKEDVQLGKVVQDKYQSKGGTVEKGEHRYCYRFEKSRKRGISLLLEFESHKIYNHMLLINEEKVKIVANCPNAESNLAK